MGSEEFDIYLDRIDDAVDALIVPAAVKGVEFLRTFVAEQTPVETGHLVGSEDVVPVIEGADLYIPGPYARRQHFGLDFHHTTGNALFLELPWMQHAQGAIDVVTDELRKAVD